MRAGREIVAWVQAYAARTARQSELDAFVTRVDDTIMSAIPEIARDPALVRDLHASTRSQFQIFLSLLERPAQEVLLPPQAVDLALSLARRQLDLGVLLQVYRSASSAVWEYFTEVVRTADTGIPSGLSRASQLAAESRANAAVTTARTSSRRAARSAMVGKPSIPASPANAAQNASWVMNSAR